MNINRDNYQAYLLDQIEGRLSPELERDLIKFLEENPDLIISQELSGINLLNVDICFPFKENIKKGGLNREINSDNYEQFCIARMEGDLTASSGKDLDDFLEKNSECAREASLYRLLVLNADKTLEFPDKNLLRKKVPAMRRIPGYFTKRLVYRAVSVAASFALLLSAYVFIQNSGYIGKSALEPVSGGIAFPEDPEDVMDKEAENVTENRVQEYMTETDPAESVNRYKTESNSELLSASALVYKQIISEANVEVSDFIRREVEDIRKPEFPLTPVQRINIETEIETVLPRSPVKLAQMACSYSGQATQQLNEKDGRRKILNGFIAVLSGNHDEDEIDGRITLLNMADAGVRAINSLTGTDIQFEREYNQNGEIVSMAFASGSFEFQRSISGTED